MSKLLNNLLGMYKQAKLNKQADEQNLKQIFEKEMGNKEPMLETANGVFYFEPKGDKIVFGTATNVGISQDYVFDYDFDMSFDQNIQNMSEEVLEKEGYYTESSKKAKLHKKANWKVLTPKDLTEEENNEFLKKSLKDDVGNTKNEDFYLVKGLKENKDDQFSYYWTGGMFGEWRTNVKGEKWYSLSDYANWDYIYLIKEDKLYKMPNRESLTDFGVVSAKRVKLRKQAEEDLIEVGWGFGNNGEDMIKGTAEELEKKIDDNFWKNINEDIKNAENDFLKDGYKKFFTKVRDEGHGSDNDLGGTAWMTKQQFEDFINKAEKTDDGIYGLFESAGTLDINTYHDDALVFHLYVYVDEETLDSLNIESKKINKNKKKAIKNTKVTKKADKYNMFGKEVTKEQVLAELKAQFKDLLTYGYGFDFWKKLYQKNWEGITEQEAKQIYDKAFEEMSKESSKRIKLSKKAKIVLEQINNEYFLNGKKGDYSDFNNDGKYKQISYNIFVDKDGKTHKVWEFAGTLDKKAGYSNNPDYFGDWFGKGQIDFSAIINPNDSGDVWMVKLWGGEGYILDVYLVKADDFTDAIDKVFEWSYENEGANKNVFDYEYLSKDCHEDYEDNFYGIDEPKPSEKMSYEEFEEEWMQDMVANSDYSLFAREENFFADKVPEEYLKGNKQSSKAKAVAKQAEEKLYVAKLYDNKGLKNDNLGKSKSVEELKDLLRDFLFEKRENRESKPQNNNFYVRDKIVIEDYYTGEPIETIKVSDLLSTYGKDYWKPFMNTKATKKQAKIELTEGVWYKVFGYPLSVKYLGEGNGGMKRFEKADGTEVIFDADVEIEPYEYSYSPFKNAKKTTAKQAVLQESENGLGYVLPNGQVVYPGDEEYLQSEKRLNDGLLKKEKQKLEKLEKHIKDNPNIDWNKYPDSAKAQAEESKGTIEYLELFNETIEDILNAFKNKKMGKQATIKHENGVYNVYSESGKCLGKGYKTKEEAEKRLKQVEYFKHKKASRRDWEFPGYETEPVDSRIEWLYTHNVNYNNTQYDYIWKLRETLKGEHVDVNENGEKVYLNKDDIEDILYYLKHHNKNYRGDQYWIIDDLKVEDFTKNLKPNKRTTLRQVVISKMAGNKNK